MKARFVACERTTVTVDQAASAFRYACNQHWNTSKPETIATLMAQSALETGRWSSMFNFNTGNIKCADDDPGLFTCFPIINEVIGGVTRWFDPSSEWTARPGTKHAERKGPAYDVPDGHPWNRFRAYESLTDGVTDKLYFLKRKRYAKAMAAALGGSPGDYSLELSKAGYYTASEPPYTRAVVSLYSTFLPVVQRGEPPAPLPQNDEERLCLDMAECMRVELPEWLQTRVRVHQMEHQEEILEMLRDRS